MTLTQEIQFEDIERVNENISLEWEYYKLDGQNVRCRRTLTVWIIHLKRTASFYIFNGYFLQDHTKHIMHWRLGCSLLELYKTPHTYISSFATRLVFLSLWCRLDGVTSLEFLSGVCECVRITSSPVSDVVDNPLQALIQSFSCERAACLYLPLVFPHWL